MTEKIAAWTEIISPRNRVFDIRLKELWHYRDLVRLLVKRDFAAQYRQTVLGPIWHLIQPILTTGMFLILFSKIAKIPTDNMPPVVFYMCGITIWNYFSTCFISTSNTFIANATIFGKVYFPRLVMPISIVCSNIIKLGIQLILLLSIMLFYSYTSNFKIDIGLHTLLLPVVILVMAGLSLGFGIIISSLTTKYRDLTVLINFGVGLLMYITPIGYSLSFIKGSSYYALIMYNPLSSVIETFRYAVLGVGDFDPYLFLYSVVCMLLSVIGGVFIFGKVEKNFMDTV